MTPEVKERIEQIRHGNVPEGYKKTAAGIIPEEWQQVRIGDVCDVNPLRAKEQDEKVTFLGMADVSEEGRLINPNIVDYAKVSKGFTPFERGDILVAKITPCFENGKGADTSALPTQQGYGSTEFHVLRSKSIDKQYMFLHTTSYEFRRKLESEMTGSAGQKRVQTESVASYLLGLPSADEQQRIAEILAVQNKVIELKEKLLAEKQRQKNYLMQQLLTGKKRLPGFDGEWTHVRANQIFKNVTDKKHDGTLEVLSATQDRGIIPRSQVDIDIKYAEESLTGYKKVVKGNFVISLRSFQGGIEYSEYTGIVSPAYTVLTSIYPIEDNYYKQFFKSADYINRLNVAVYGIRDGKQISYDDFGRIKIPYPPLDEQKAIATVLATADKEIEILKQTIEQEKQKKKALMQLLLTGIVRVNV